jgi:hypothetical protein
VPLQVNATQEKSLWKTARQGLCVCKARELPLHDMACVLMAKVSAFATQASKVPLQCKATAFARQDNQGKSSAFARQARKLYLQGKEIAFTGQGNQSKARQVFCKSKAGAFARGKASTFERKGKCLCKEARQGKWICKAR